MALAQRIQTNNHHGSDGFNAHRLTESGRMRTNEVNLQLCNLLGRYALMHQRTKTGVDSVNGFTF